MSEPKHNTKQLAVVELAQNFLKRHHWRFCPPSDKWPEGSWDCDEAKKVYEALNTVLSSPNDQAGEQMQREHRYMVFKLKDMRAALSQYEDALLKHLAGKINDYRIREGKAPLQCVVVESDWPEYEPTWHAIEGRVVAAAPSPPQDPAHAILAELAQITCLSLPQQIEQAAFDLSDRAKALLSTSPPQDPRDEALRVAREALDLISYKLKFSSDATDSDERGKVFIRVFDVLRNEVDKAIRQIKKLMGEK